MILCNNQIPYTYPHITWQFHCINKHGQEKLTSWNACHFQGSFHLMMSFNPPDNSMRHLLSPFYWCWNWDLESWNDGLMMRQLVSGSNQHDSKSVLLQNLWGPFQVTLEPSCPCIRWKRPGFNPWVGTIPSGGPGNLLHYSCLENPWMQEPGGLQSMGSQRVKHDWSNLACMHACIPHHIVK